MKFACGAFNIILVALVALTTGCLTDGMPKAKDASTLKLFLETGRQLNERIQDVTVFTDPPIKLNVETEPFIEESDITGAKLIEADGRFAVQVTFSHHGSLVLETTSYAQRGKFIAIFSQFPEPRWIGDQGAPNRNRLNAGYRKRRISAGWRGDSPRHNDWHGTTTGL